jgi:hypothetical protein
MLFAGVGLADGAQHADHAGDNPGFLDEGDLPLEDVRTVMIEAEDVAAPHLVARFLDAMILSTIVPPLRRFSSLLVSRKDSLLGVSI